MQEDNFSEELKTNIKTLTQCEWVREEFKNALFGDRRLYLRLLVVAEHLARHPEAPISQANEVWKKTKAAYRFFDNKKATPEVILAPHVLKTFERISLQSDEVLIAQDTSFLNYSHMVSSTDLGPIGDLGQSTMGLVMHTSLAVTLSGLSLGIIDQQIWVRPVEEHGKAKDRSKKPIEEKESFKWLKALRQYSLFHPTKKVITVCDRESDIYDFFSDAARLNAQVVVRAKHDRNLEEEGKKLWEFMEQRSIATTDAFLVQRQPGRPERTTKIQIRFAPVVFTYPKDRPKGDKLPSLSLFAVYVTEIDPPQDGSPISWMLLTNIPTTTLADARKCIQRYKQRWQIEILHRIVKSGCRIEDARLEKNHRRIPYITLCCIIAWKLLQITHYSRISPQEPATALLSQTECDVLYSVTHSTLVQQHSFNMQKATQWLAQLGGFMGRKSDKFPGPTHVWRGWQRLQDFTHMHTLSRL